MNEPIMLCLLAAFLALAAVGLFRVTVGLRQRGRSHLTELVGAILLITAGVAVLLRGTFEHRGLVLSGTLLVSIGLVWLVETSSNHPIGIRRDPIRCSFCGKSQRDVRKIVQATDACICDECVEICRNTIDAET